ncbi:hypothetical protein JG688_00007747, partial [Phytophthora aleatoria]
HASRTDYRSLLGRLHHAATCVRPARPFLQLRLQEHHLRRWQQVTVSEDMKHDPFGGPSFSNRHRSTVCSCFFHNHPPPGVIVELDASETRIRTLVLADRLVLHY